MSLTVSPPKDRVLAISEATQQDLCNYKGIDPSRVFVTPLAADTTRLGVSTLVQVILR